MAKPEKGKMRIRFFEVDLEGSDETLLESVRNAAILANRGGPVRVIKQLGATTNPAHEATMEGPSEEPVFAEEQLFDSDASGAAQSLKTKRSARSYATPEVLDIDLKGGAISFAAYVDTAKPDDTTKKYLIVAAWLKEHRQISSIDANHVYTCFRAAGWGVQKDLLQPFRDGKRQGYFKTAGRGAYEITHIGLDVVHKLTNAVN
jgi:hypothetical protein